MTKSTKILIIVILSAIAIAGISYYLLFVYKKTASVGGVTIHPYTGLPVTPYTGDTPSGIGRWLNNLFN